MPRAIFGCSGRDGFYHGQMVMFIIQNRHGAAQVEFLGLKSAGA
jgi:hypothetical protein